MTALGFCGAGNARKSLKKNSGRRDSYATGIHMGPASELYYESASFAPSSDHDRLNDRELCPEDTILSSEFCASPDVCEAHSEVVEDVSDVVESRRESPLTVQLADAIRWLSGQTTRGRRRRKRRSDFTTASEDDRSTAANRTSSLTVRRRGKGAAIYCDQLRSAGWSEVGREETRDDDDVTDFVVVGGAPSRRAKWLDADLDAIGQRAFTCRLSWPALGSLVDRFGSRVAEGRSTPRRFLVNLLEEEEIAAAVDEHNIHRSNWTPVRGDEAPPRRLLLVVEDLELPGHQPTSASGHVTCRFAAILYCH